MNKKSVPTCSIPNRANDDDAGGGELEQSGSPPARSEVIAAPTSGLEADNPDMVPARRTRTRFPYTPAIGEEIADLYVDNSISAIGRISGMPPAHAIYKWMRDNEDFRKLMLASRKVKALEAEEKAMEAAYDPEEKADVPQARLKFDAERWRAGVLDPETYGNRTTISGDGNRPLQLILSTGVPEPTDAQQPPVLTEDGRVVPRAKEPQPEMKEVPSEVADAPAAGCEDN